MRELHAAAAAAPATAVSGSAETEVRPSRASRLLSDGSIHHKAFRLGTTEPPSVTLLKKLQGPMVTVATLAACLLACGVRLSFESLALATIVFLIGARVLSAPEPRIERGGKRQHLERDAATE